MIKSMDGNLVKSADAVVIGGGSVGVAAAYELAKKRFGKVVLLEKDYLAAGSTGRSGAGIRQQWGTELNCVYCRKSSQMFEVMNEELEYEGDVEFRQSGYLLLAHTESVWEQLQKNIVLQHRLGIPSRALTPEQAREIVPVLNTDGLLGATFCQEDGHVNPFNTTDAYAAACIRLGAKVYTGTEVTGVKLCGDKITGISTNRGDIDTPLVISAVGPWSRVVGQMVGVDIPITPERHQILITEPVEQVIGPMVMSFYHTTYCQQVPHGGFLMGFGNPHEPKGFDIGHSWQFMETMARKIVDVLPALKGIRVVRQWSGLYDLSPDGQPILGFVPGMEGFCLAIGSAKGFMLAPAIGLVIAELLCGEQTSLPIDRLDLGRFARGEYIVEPSVV